MTPEMILAAFGRHGDPDVRLAANDLAAAWTALQAEITTLKTRVAAADRAIAERDRRIETMATTSLRAHRQATGDVPVVVERRPEQTGRPQRVTGDALVVEKVSAQIGDRDASSVAARVGAASDGPSWRDTASADRAAQSSTPRERTSAERRLFANTEPAPTAGGTTRPIGSGAGNTSVLMAVLTGTHEAIATEAAATVGAVSAQAAASTSTPNVFDAADLIGEPKTLRIPPPIPSQATQPRPAADEPAPSANQAAASWSGANEIEFDADDEDEAFLQLQESFVDSGRFDDAASTAVGRFRTATRN